ncbi:hypothetical protein [Trichormus variabilis]|uniref:hypothetical protein n=1 Tax=Anabaena variabilis TaxID=264691 RepID=UPI00168BA358|nr:hypothetical protein [Trichormus variabilis]MBD2352784.1 hypothetical protein [Trichormus variabilis FACHB-171]
MWILETQVGRYISTGTPSSSSSRTLEIMAIAYGGRLCHHKCNYSSDSQLVRSNKRKLRSATLGVYAIARRDVGDRQAIG